MSNGLLSSEYCTFCYKVLEFIFVIFSIGFYYYLPYLSKTDVKKLVMFNRADNSTYYCHNLQPYTISAYLKIVAVLGRQASWRVPKFRLQ